MQDPTCTPHHARTTTSAPIAITTAPIARADSVGQGPSRSKETATATAATTATFIIPPTSRTAIRPRQHRLQFTPNRTPCRRVASAALLAGAPQARHTANWRAFHALTCTAPATSSAAPVASGANRATAGHWSPARHADLLRADSQISPPDRSAFQELGNDALNRRDRDRQRRATRERRGVDAEDSGPAVYEGAAGKPIVDREVEPQQGVDLGTLPRTPRTSHTAHHAPARRETRAGPPEGDHQLTRFRSVRPGTGGWEARIGEPQDGEVGAGIAPGQGRWTRCPVGKCHRDAFFTVDRVMRGDDHARPPVNAARRNAPSRVYRDNRSAGRLDRSRELGRKGLQDCAHGFLRHHADVSARSG